MTSPLARSVTLPFTYPLTAPFGTTPGEKAVFDLTGYRVVATRASMQWGTTAIAAPNNTIEGRSRNRITAAGLDRVRVLFADWGVSSSSPISEYANLNAIPFQAALEWDSPAAFGKALKNGADPTISPGGVLVTDEILAATLGLSTFDQYGIYWERVSSALVAGTWLQGMKALRITGEFGFRHNPAALQAYGTGAMVQSGGAGQRAYMPVAVIGKPSDANYKAVVGIGDSRMQGSADTDDTTEGGLGFFQRACMWDGTRAIASLNLGRGGDSWVDWNAGHSRRKALIPLATHAVLWNNFNDVNSYARTAAQVVADTEAAAAECYALGIKKVCAVNMTPRTGGTAGSQTVVPAFSIIRDDVNTGLSASLSAGKFDNILDAYTLMRDPAAVDKWTTTYFSEGIHPNAAGHAVLATALKTILAGWGF